MSTQLSLHRVRDHDENHDFEVLLLRHDNGTHRAYEIVAATPEGITTALATQELTDALVKAVQGE